jgi:hypothetical protein
VPADETARRTFRRIVLALFFSIFGGGVRIAGACTPPAYVVGVSLSEPIIAEVLEALPYPKVLKAARSKTDPALWFKEERASLDALTMHFERSGTDARCAL